MSPHKIFVQEQPTDREREGFDHVFSFCYARADSYPDAYMNFDQEEAIYHEVYQAVIGHLKHLVQGEDWNYRGVNLLWCYKKSLFFEFAYYTRLRYEALKALAQRYPDSHIYLKRRSQTEDWIHPYLDQVIAASPFRRSAQIDWIAKPTRALRKRPQASRLDLKSFIPRRMRYRDMKNQKVVFFCDPLKSRQIRAHLGFDDYVCYSNSASLRLLGDSLSKGFGSHQAVYGGSHKKVYEQKASVYIQRLIEKNPFTGLRSGDLEIGEVLAQKFAGLLNERLANLLFDIDAMHAFFKSARSLQSSFLDEDTSPARNAFCQIASQYGVQTFVECHGALGHPIGFLPLTADRICVWGRAQAKKLVRWGCPEERILVTGCSRYTPYLKQSSDAAKEIVSHQIRMDLTSPVILIAYLPIRSRTRLFENKLQNMLQEVLALAEDYGEARFLVKMHPGDPNAQLYYSWFEKLDRKQANRIRLLKHHDSLLLARACDLLITCGSTFAVDGFAMDRPVICVEGRSFPMYEEFNPYGVFWHAHGRSELRKGLEDFLNNNLARSPRWHEAKQECLYTDSLTSEEIITKHLLEPKLEESFNSV